MALHDTFRGYLVAVDVEGVRRLWSHVFPNMPAPPADDAQCVAQIHLARSQMQSIDFKHRAYSHRWLIERGYPSAMPDNLRPKAERMYPVIAEAVGVAVHTKNPLLKPVAAATQRAMQDAVEDAYAEGRRDPEFVKARMAEARERTLRYYGELLHAPRK